MKKTLLAVVATAALTGSALSLANSHMQPRVNPNAVHSSAGFYMNGSLGYGQFAMHKSDRTTYISSLHTLFDTQDTGQPVHVATVSLKRNTIAWASSLGYQLNPAVGVEVGYMQLPRMKVIVNSQKAKLDSHAVTADVKASFPVDDTVALFGKAGVAIQKGKYLNMHPTGAYNLADLISKASSQVVGLVGLGMDYNIGNNMAVTVEGIATLQSASYNPTYTGLLGINYKFA